jgi:hypothetical protein
MRSFFRFAFVALPLLGLAGCDTKPTPADPPKQLMEPPKTRPTPTGGGNAPAQTSQISQPHNKV